MYLWWTVHGWTNLSGAFRPVLMEKLNWIDAKPHKLHIRTQMLKFNIWFSEFAHVHLSQLSLCSDIMYTHFTHVIGVLIKNLTKLAKLVTRPARGRAVKWWCLKITLPVCSQFSGQLEHTCGTKGQAVSRQQWDLNPGTLTLPRPRQAILTK